MSSVILSYLKSLKTISFDKADYVTSNFFDVDHKYVSEKSRILSVSLHVLLPKVIVDIVSDYAIPEIYILLQNKLPDDVCNIIYEYGKYYSKYLSINSTLHTLDFT